MLKTLYSILFALSSSCLGVLVSNKPIYTIFTPNSLLNNVVKPVPFQMIGERGRYSTCTGVQWFHDDNYMATVNFGGNAIHTYKFDRESKTVTPLQVITNEHGAKLAFPENINFSNDGTFAAIANSKDGTINIYSVDLNTHLIDPKPFFTLQYSGKCGVHGVRFSPDMNYIVFTTIHADGPVCVYRILNHSERSMKVEQCSNFKNKYLPLKPKSIDFTKDSKYIVITYSPMANAKVTVDSLFAICHFDNKKGIINNIPIGVYKLGRVQCDDAIFSRDNSYLVLSNQTDDKISIYGFDKINGVINNYYKELINPHAQLSFPHGIAISLNGKFLAVSNYGGDKVTIYSII